MKKFLALLSIAFVAQGLLAESTQYKYLNRLHEDSQIRKQCEQKKRAWFVKGETEKACDLLDNMFTTTIQFHRNNYRDYKKIEDFAPYIFVSKECEKRYEEALSSYMLKLGEQVPSQEEQNKALSVLGVDLNDNGGKYLGFLHYDILEEATNYAKQLENQEQMRRDQFFELMFKQNQKFN
jgi:hypothetical protein